MPGMSAPARKGAQAERHNAHRLSAIVGASALAHAAALGALLMSEPVPVFTPQEVIEISLVPERAAPRAVAGDPRADGSAAAPSGRPDVPASAASRDWLRGIGVGHAFAVPGPSSFGVHTPAPAFDTLAATHDCLATGRATGGGSGRARHPTWPCAWEDPPLRTFLTAQRPTDASRPNEVGADNDYRTFKTIQPLFDESLFPDKVPQANGALKGWFANLFR